MDPRDRAGASFWFAYLVCAAAFAVPFCLSPHPPLVELPLRAAELVSPAVHAGPSPRPLPDALAALAGTLLPPPLAARAPFLAGLLALPVGLLVLLRRTGGDPWWSLLGFPLAMGYGWWQGWSELVLGAALAALAIAAAHAHARRPGALRGIAAALAVAALAGCDRQLLLATSCAAVLAVGAIRGADPKGRLPIVAGTLAGLVFSLVNGGAPRPIDPAPLLQRQLALLGSYFGAPWDRRAIAFTAITLLVLFGAARARPVRDLQRWGPAAIALLVAAFVPSARGLGLAVLVPLFGLAALNAGEARRGRLVIVLAALAWAVVIAARLTAFAGEARHVDAVLSAAPPGATLEARIDDPSSVAVPGFPVYRHAAWWYRAERNGTVVPYLGAVRLVRRPDRREATLASSGGWALVAGVPVR